MHSRTPNKSDGKVSADKDFIIIIIIILLGM